MNSDGKKISFGFSKLSKKPNVLALPAKDKSIELIECVEGAEIKLKNEVKKIEKAPLIIAIKGDANHIVSQIERESLKNRKIKTESNDEDTRPDSELTIEELAARQLLREARNKLAQSKDTTKVHTLALEESKLTEDAKEPSLDDYENVPIEDFGLACLRGMGWKEGMSIGKNQSKFVKPPEPDLRSKGLGLGAQKILDIPNKEEFDKDGKKLVLAKGAFAKIIAGVHNGKFCEVQFCDEWSGRVSVKTSNSDEILTLNELFVVPISKDEYTRGSRVINNAKYEQYKMIEEIKKESSDKFDVAQRNHSRSSSEETNKSRNQDLQVKKEEMIDRVKVEHTISDEDIPRNIERTVKHKDLKNNFEKSSSSKIREDISYNRGGRSREKSGTNHKAKYEKNSSEEERKSVRKDKSSDRNSNGRNKYKSGKQENKSTYSSDQNVSSTSDDSSDEYHRKKSKTRKPSMSRSSSDEYKKKYVQKTHKHKKHSKKHKKYRNEEKKSKRGSSKYSDDERERNSSRRYDSDTDGCEEIRKSKKKKSYRKKRDSSSDSDDSREKSKYKADKSTSEKYKSRH